MKAILLLCGDLDEKTLTIPTYNETGDYSSSGSYARVLSTSYMAAECCFDKIIISGGKGKLKCKIERSLCEHYEGILRRLNELIFETGDITIVAESLSNNTYQQLLYSDIKDCKSITIITNTYHVGRVRSMINNCKDLEKYRQNNVTIASAEQILKYKNTTLNYEIEMAYKSPAMQACLDQEKKGIEALEKGEYSFDNFTIG